MARVEVAMQAWGYVVDLRGRPRSGAVCDIDTPVYVAAAGATEISDSGFITNAEGYLPGFVDQGTYTFEDPDGDQWQVEAASGVGGGPTGPTGPTGPAGLPPGWVSLKADFGAVGDGAADDSAEIQALMDYLQTTGGTGYVPPGTYKHDTEITLNGPNLKPWRLTGCGGWHHQNISLTRFVFTGGAGTGPGWDIQDNYAWEIDHLKFSHNNVAFGGIQMDVDHGPPTNLDAQLWQIHDCGFNSQVASAAAVGLRLNKAIIGSVQRCHFGRFGHSIRLNEAGGSYTVGVKITDCTFNFYLTAAIAVGGADIESVSIGPNNVFEDPVGASAVLGLTGNACYNLRIENNWFGDATAASNWIDGLNAQSNNYVCTITNNTFGTAANGYHLGDLDGHWIVEKNSFTSDNLFTTPNGAPARLVLRDNYLNNLDSLWDTQPAVLIAQNNQIAGTSKRVDDITKRMLVGGKDEGSLLIQTASPTDGEASGQLIIGQKGGAGAPVAPTVTTRAAIYTSGSGANAEHLYLQAGADANGVSREVRIAAGTTPANKLRANNTGIAFHDTAPIAKPTVTGSRGGNAALASSLTALANYGLITDSTSA